MKRKQNAEFVVSLLELFEGRLSVDDILNRELPWVYEMVAAKEELLEKKEQLRKKMEAEAQAVSKQKRK